MQKLLTKSVAVFTACALIATLVAVPFGAIEAYGVEKDSSSNKTTQSSKTASTTKKTATAVMKKLKLKWDLKNNKSVTVTEPYASIGAKQSKIKMTGYKVKNASKKGYKTVSFTLVKTLAWKPTQKDVHKMLSSDYFVDTESVGGGVYVAVVDYATGKSLLTDTNKYDVTVRSSSWEFSKPLKKSDKDKCHTLELMTKARIHVAITYPSSYKNLCIGVGGYNVKAETKTDTKFWNGTAAITKTSYIAKGKTNSHWLRVK